MVNAHKLIPGQTEFDAADIEYMIAKIDAQTIEEYALKFGGLIVPNDMLIAYKAEYRTKLVSMLDKVAPGATITFAQT